MSLRLPEWTVTVDGRDYLAEIAQVERFHLGIEDHGLFTADVAFCSGGWGQSLAAHALDTYDESAKRRIGTAFGCDYIIGVCRAIGSPEQAKGKRVVVLREKPYGMIVGFAALNDDGTTGEPFIPQRLADRHFPTPVSGESA